MEEDLEEEVLMNMDSPPPRDASDGREEEELLHYVHPGRVDVEQVTLPKKASTILAMP